MVFSRSKFSLRISDLRENELRDTGRERGGTQVELRACSSTWCGYMCSLMQVCYCYCYCWISVGCCRSFFNHHTLLGIHPDANAIPVILHTTLEIKCRMQLSCSFISIFFLFLFFSFWNLLLFDRMYLINSM